MPSRRTARAIALASIWSDLPGSRSPRREAPISFGATRITRSPALMSAFSRWWERSRQSSIAHTISLSRLVRPAQRVEMALLPGGDFPLAEELPGRSASTAARAWVLLWTSAPITIIQHVPSIDGSRLSGPSADRPFLGAVATLLLGHAKGPGWWRTTQRSVRSGQSNGRQTDYESVRHQPRTQPGQSDDNSKRHLSASGVR